MAKFHVYADERPGVTLCGLVMRYPIQTVVPRPTPMDPAMLVRVIGAQTRCDDDVCLNCHRSAWRRTCK